MKVDLFDFDLPQDRIALRPVSPRDAAKMLVVEGDAPFADRQVRDLPDLLRAGDVLVFNDTRVIPAQLEGERIREGASGAAIGATLHKRLDARRWQAFVRNAKRLREGDTIQFPDGVSVTAEARAEDGSWTLAFAGDEPVEELLARAGAMPLPPYIAQRRAADERDAQDYQTLFADKAGAVAAPTAALHFTPELVERLDAAGIVRETLTLHVGAGTFLPVKATDTAEHRMHAEWGRIDAATAERQSKSGIGYNVGVDFTYFLQAAGSGARVGLGTLVRFSRASIDFASEDGDTIAVEAGGLYIGGGLRLRF